jgi:hypothetical protein
MQFESLAIGIVRSEAFPGDSGPRTLVRHGRKHPPGAQLAQLVRGSETMAGEQHETVKPQVGNFGDHPEFYHRPSRP